MPIANCIVLPDCSAKEGDLIDMWARESGVAPDHMTVNVIESQQQFGNSYKVMATLYLPTLWSEEKTNALQLGLATSLVQYFGVAPNEVHVITTVVDSGFVVENMKIERW